MESSAPLLCTDSVGQETTGADQLSSPSSIDNFIEWHLRSFNYMQFIQAILLSLPMSFDAQQTFISVFTDAEPTCNHSASSFCFKTIVSEWGLESASSLVIGLPSSSFFIGSLLGGFILSALGDSILGRKKLLFYSCFAMCLAALFTVFSTNIWMYSVLRFFTGFARSPIMTSAIVLLMEMAGRKWRGLMVVLGFVCFLLGLLSLPPIAYAKRSCSWRSLYLWTSIPSIFYCIIVYFMVNESPRWLFLHGHEAEAIAVLRRLSSVKQNGSTHVDLIRRENAQDANLYSSMNLLFKSRWALRKLLWVMPLAFGIGMVYYGILLGVGNLNFNLYLGVTFNGILDLPAYFLTFILIERWNRKSSILGFCVLSGVSSILCVLIKDKKQGNLEIGLELISLTSVCTAFNMVLIYTTELFPTIVRNSATAMVRQAINFGAVFSPILISYGRKFKFLSYGVFGLVVTACGFFILCLPETRGVIICDTLNEQEEKDSTIV